MGQWNLREWRFDWSNSTRNLGDCSHRTKTIRLSLPYTLRLSEAGVRETVLHEVAHALAPPNARSHGREWRALAKLVGATPKAKIRSGVRFLRRVAFMDSVGMDPPVEPCVRCGGQQFCRGRCHACYWQFPDAPTAE
jgi:hypothetical protein